MDLSDEPLAKNNLALSSRYLALNTVESIYLIHSQEIVRCEAANNYTYFFLHDKRKILVCKTLGEYEIILEAWGFVRIHQSHLINIQYLERYDKKDGGQIVMRDQSTLPVSSRKKDKLIQILRTRF